MLSLLNLGFKRLPGASHLSQPKSVPPLPFHSLSSPTFSPLSCFSSTERSGTRPFQACKTHPRNPALCGDQNAAASGCCYRLLLAPVSTSHGPTQRRAVPPVGLGASQRAEEMLGQTAGDQCTEVCYYSNHCGNHGNAVEDWPALHCHCHRVCHRGRRRLQG